MLGSLPAPLLHPPLTLTQCPALKTSLKVQATMFEMFCYTWTLSVLWKDHSRQYWEQRKHYGRINLPSLLFIHPASQFMSEKVVLNRPTIMLSALNSFTALPYLLCSCTPQHVLLVKCIYLLLLVVENLITLRFGWLWAPQRWVANFLLRMMRRPVLLVEGHI